MSRNKAILLAACVLSLAAVAATLAAADSLANGFAIPWWTVDNGGGTSQGGDYSLSGTAGQPDAGNLSGESYTLQGGFWSGPAVNLGVSKIDAPDPVKVNGSLTYTIAVYNQGLSAAPGVVLTDTLPSGVTFGWSAPDFPTCAHAAGQVVCSLGLLQPSETLTVTLGVTPTVPGTIVNQVVVASGAPDSISADNQSSQSTLVEEFMTYLALIIR